MRGEFDPPTWRLFNAQNELARLLRRRDELRARREAETREPAREENGRRDEA